jgi:hypothetical protein
LEGENTGKGQLPPPTKEFILLFHADPGTAGQRIPLDGPIALRTGVISDGSDLRERLKKPLMMNGWLHWYHFRLDSVIETPFAGIWRLEIRIDGQEALEKGFQVAL